MIDRSRITGLAGHRPRVPSGSSPEETTRPARGAEIGRRSPGSPGRKAERGPTLREFLAATAAAAVVEIV